MRKFELVAPDTVTVCAAGTAPPCAWLNAIGPEGEMFAEFLDVRFNVTGIFSDPPSSPPELI